MSDTEKKLNVLSKLGQALGLAEKPTATEAASPHHKLAEYQRLKENIPGFFDDGNAAVWDMLLEFQESLPIQGPMFEIGVFHGRSALMAALHLRAHEQFLLVDGTKLLRKAEVNLSPVLGKRGVYVEVMSDQLRVEEYRSFWRACRWIHVDGGHTGQAVTNDLAMVDQLLHEQGVVVMDDFFNPAYPQLTDAVFAYLNSNRFKLSMFLCGWNKAYLARPIFARTYRQWIREHMAAGLHSRGMHQFTLWKTATLDESAAIGIGVRMTDRDWQGLDTNPDDIPIG